ncbi:outer membrane protein assembly factor BamA [Celeribacter indicus]|uniref:Outer membrane protein assembly factor BamA n=1 Tax=Celeribacter indicus TaxID=1208324 RepID=A0A0B5E1P5_9RHOB|nr:outer membrane protein assembly factor BamA [Celeribacter indicus]AJE47330.1 surface antigen (D15) [Celeribacter indicus]SDW03646.1 Beta-barrel assembly machine subunit BamA [Celeribacter indicus]
MTRGSFRPKQRLTARALALTCSAFAVSTVAYTSFPTPAVAQSYSFSNVTIEGAQRISADTILSYAGIARGQAVSAGELNDAYQAVLGSGLFETVEFVPQGNTLVIRVSEYPVVSRIAIEGNRALSDDVLLPMLTTKVRRVYSPSDVEADAALITEGYETKGQLVATVTPKIIRRDNNRVDVVFEVTEGKGVEVERLSFVGNRSFSDYRLRRVLDTKQAGLLRFIIGRDTYAEERIEFDKRVLTDFYTSRGYVDFEVLNVAAEFSRERNAYFLTFNLREGLKYDFGTMTISSQVPEANVADFQRAINIRAGQTYSPTAVDNVISRMEAIATEKGIDFLRVEPRVTRNPRTQTLDIDFAMVRGPRVFIERIDIEGNATTLDRVVRRQFRVVEGDPFNPREIREAAERIRALGFFSNADVNTRQGSSDEQVVVDVDVTEQPTGSFTFGANFSVSEGANLIASFSEQNFLGRGQRLSFNFTTKLDDGNLSFNFVEPAFLGRNVAFGLAGGLSSSQPSYAEHITRRAYLSPRLTFPVSANGSLTLNYRAELSEVTEDDDYIDNGNVYPDMIQEDIDDGRMMAHSVGYSYSYDTRRSGLNPNAGFLLRFGQDYAGLLGGDVDYVKSSAEVTGEMRVWNEEVTLRATLEGGVIDADGDSRISDRYFNSSQIMRGFEPGGIGPRDSGDDELALGGNYFAVARLEAQFPLGLPEEYGLAGGVFLDYGSVWGLDDTSGIIEDSDDLHWRSVIGASVFWTTPLGPLRFNFTKALEKEDYDEEQNFDLTISTRF